VETEWRRAIWGEVDAHQKNQYIVLTKRPGGINPDWILAGDKWPQNLWVGTSITGTVSDGAATLDLAERIPRDRRVVSLEPLLGPTTSDYPCTILGRPSWLIVGPQTGPRAVTPPRHWVQDLIDYADEYHVPLWLKSRCYDLWPDLPLRQERPPEMVAACESAKRTRTTPMRRS
jgi:protein gp37